MLQSSTTGGLEADTGADEVVAAGHSNH